MIIIICRPLIGHNDRLQVVAAVWQHWWQHCGSTRHQLFPGWGPGDHPFLQSFLQLQSLYSGCICNTQGTLTSSSPPSADDERCQCCKILLHPAAGSRVRSSLEVLEMCKGEARGQASSIFCPQVQRPCRPGGTQ